MKFSRPCHPLHVFPRFPLLASSRLVHTMPERFKKATIPFILDLCLRKIQAGKSRDFVTSSFSKSSVFKMFRPHKNAKLAFSNSFGLKRVFEKLRFRISTEDCGPNCRNKLAFSNFSGFVCILPN